MFDVGGGELLLIVLAVLVLFGPKKIPEVAAMIGKGMRKVRQAQDEFTQHMRDLSTDLEHVGESPRVSSTVNAAVNSNIHSLPEAEVVENSVTELSTPHVSSEPQPAIIEDIEEKQTSNSTLAEVEPIVRIQPAPGSVSR